jgi:uncharacterized membrane protein YgdD (TMEM256/DUF423 family)
MNKAVLSIASVLGATAVILGAFGAHALKAKLSAADLAVWKTGVEYHFYHTLAILLLAVAGTPGSKPVVTAAWLFTAGIVLFSGSLYLLSTRGITGLKLPFLGPVTPVGGLFFIAGWITLLVWALSRKNA